MKNKILKIINYLIEAGIILAVFFVPLYFSFFYSNTTLFSLDKVIILRVLIEILVILSLIKILIKKEIGIFLERKFFIFFLFFIIVFCSINLFSFNFYNSFWGSYFRQLGLFTYLHYFLFLIILFLNIDKKEKIRRLINFILLSSFLISLYGILQWFGIEFISWQSKLYSSPGGRVVSTMGQPVFLGNYLILVIFFSIYKIIINKKFLDRFFFILLFLLQFFCLLFTYTRGAWLGFLFGIFLSLFLYFLIIKKKIIKTTIFFFLIIFFIFSSFLLLSNYFGEPENSVYSRFKSSFNFKSGSLAMRIETWQASMASIANSPIKGYGLENQSDSLVGYYNSNWSVYEKINTVSDRAHNIILDIMLEGGIIMLLTYLFFLFFVFKKAINFLLENKFKNKDNYLLFFIIISFFSYCFSLLFSFFTVETGLFFWLYLGLILIILNNFKENIIFNFKEYKNFYFYFLILIVFFISIFFINLIFNNIKYFKADYYFKEARINYLKNDYKKMFDNYVLALNLNNKENYYKWFFVYDSLTTLEKINSEEYRNYVLDYIKNIFGESFGKEESFSRMLGEANFYTILGRYKDENYFKIAEEKYKKIIKRSSFFPNSYLEWAKINVYKKDYKKAITINKIALSVLPDLNNPYLNLEHEEYVEKFVIEVYQNIAYCYMELKEYEEALNYYLKIIKLNSYKIEAYKSISDVCYLLKDIDKAIWYNKRGYMLNPNDYFWSFSIALLYEEKGDNKNALEYAKKALKLYPENESIKKLIEKL